MMSPSKAAKVHQMRFEHYPYGTIAKELGVKRNTMQCYYYQWLKTKGKKPWGI